MSQLREEQEWQLASSLHDGGPNDGIINTTELTIAQTKMIFTRTSLQPLHV